MSRKYFVCLNNGVAVAVENNFNDCGDAIEGGSCDTVVVASDVNDLAAVLAGSCDHDGNFDDDYGGGDPAPVVESQVPQTPKEAFVALICEYKPQINAALDVITNHPLFEQVKSEFKRLFGDTYRDFVSKVAQTLGRAA